MDSRTRRVRPTQSGSRSPRTMDGYEFTPASSSGPTKSWDPKRKRLLAGNL